jgi:anti-sigma B factor antagonist
MPDLHVLPDPPEPLFECACTDPALDAAWVRVAGALDIATAPRLVRTLRESQTRLVVLDLRDLAFMDCSGVHAIVDASSSARDAGRRLLLLRGPAHIDRIFALTGHSHDVETSDLGPLESPAGALQRSLVLASLMRDASH